jgi:bacteriocin-like protein
MDQNTVATVTPLTDAELATIEGGSHTTTHAQVQTAAITGVVSLTTASIQALAAISAQP